MLFSHPPSFLKQLYPSLLWKMDTSEKKIYLTFDDGPEAGVTDLVLDKLKEAGAKATFFCVGNNVKKNTTLFERVLWEGHKVGNHTFNHVNGWKTTSSEYIADVQKFERQYKSKLFRPPYGKLKASQIKLLKSQYKIVMWSILTMDYDFSLSPEKCKEIAVSGWENGSIIVLHDSHKAKKNMLVALDAILQKGKEEGWKFEAI